MFLDSCPAVSYPLLSGPSVSNPAFSALALWHALNVQSYIIDQRRLYVAADETQLHLPCLPEARFSNDYLNIF